MALKFEQYLLEKLARDLLAGGDLADHQRVFGAGEREQRMQCVFGPLRDHGSARSLDLGECRIDAEAPRHDGDFSGDMVEVGRDFDLDSVAVTVHFEIDTARAALPALERDDARDGAARVADEI